MTSILSLRQPIAARSHFLISNLLIIASLVIMAAFSAYQSRLQYQQQARTSADNLTQVLGNRIGGTLEKIDLALNTVALEAERQLARGGIDRKEMNRFLARQKPFLPEARDLLVADAQGIFRYGANATSAIGVDISYADYFMGLRDAPRSGLFISGPYQSHIDQQWVMVFARRLDRPDGSFAGTVSSAILADDFRTMLTSLDLGLHGLVALHNGEMKLIARVPDAGLRSKLGTRITTEPFVAAMARDPGYGTFTAVSPLDHTERSFVYRRLPGFPLYIVVGQAPGDYLAPWWEVVFRLAGMVAAFSLVVLWLSRVAQRTAQVHQATRRLLQEAVESLAIGFCIFDPEDRLSICNEAKRNFFPNCHDALAPGAKFEDILRIAVARGNYAEPPEGYEHWLQERLRRHQAADGKPFEVKLGDGRQLLVIEHRTASGHTVVNQLDITELAHYRNHLEKLVEVRTADQAEAEAALRQLNQTLEERVRERTSELVVANRELEGFTYAASHDMKAPLGRINSFSTLLGRQYREQLVGDGLLFLDLIQQNATRLHALVEDLLAHAQVGQHPLVLQPVPVLATIQTVLHEQAEEIRRSGAEIQLDLPAGMTVRGDPLSFGQVLRNLVENALKYSSSAKPPVIEISGQEENEICRLWVRDNGIGIEPAYQERIFEIFRRLHTYNEYPGTGVGLALVRKAMERMGGRVWVESEPGEGAVFYVELPA